MTLVADLVRQAAEHLRSERGVEAGLDRVAEIAEAAKDPNDVTSGTRRALKERIQALEAAQVELRSLVKAVEHLKGVLRSGRKTGRAGWNTSGPWPTATRPAPLAPGWCTG
jgi:hypothetical protein